MISKTNLVVAFFVAAVLAGLFLKFGPTTSVLGRENFMQQEVGMPLSSGGMGPYDGVNVAGGVSGWLETEPSTLGSAPISGENNLMLLAGNKTSSECCPAAFNTDTGCVCLTESDRTLFASRGGNRA
jgi:hypothetical protein